MKAENRGILSKIERLNQQYYDLQTQKKEVEEQLNSSHYKSFHLQTEKERLEKDRKNFVFHVEQLNQELSNVKNELSEKKRELEELEQELLSLRSQQPSTNLRGKRNIWDIEN